jgi:Fe-S-cluster containining protein
LTDEWTSSEHSATGADAPYRYLTLAATRALECNGCGDCCDSRRSDGYWAWSSLPAGQYAEHCGGSPLVIPIELVDGDWRDRLHVSEDSAELSPTRFRCSAFRTSGDGGTCTRHGSWRPSQCEEFPAGGDAVETELAEHGSVLLESVAFPRCTWYRIVVIAPGDSRLAS